MPDDWFDRGVGFALEALATPGNKVLSHCHMGINRGPSLAYAVLLGQGVDPIEAIELVRRARGIAAVGYAEDALSWHLRSIGASPEDRGGEGRRLHEWRRKNPLDVVRIIRRIRAEEALGRIA